MYQRRIVVDDTDPRIHYQGEGWFQDAGSQDRFGSYGSTYNHTLHGTKVNNSSLSFEFKGTSMTLMGTTNPAKIDETHYDPSWECFIDNISIGATPPFGYQENNWVLCSHDSLADGPHTLTLNVTVNEANTFWFDSIQFVPSAGDTYGSEVVVIENNDSGFQWESGWEALGVTLNITTVHGSVARFNFIGTGLTWVGLIPREFPQKTSSGSYSIDGGDPTSFALSGLPANADDTYYNQAFFTTPPLSVGPHSLIVTYDGDSQHVPLTMDYLYLSVPSLSLSADPTPTGPPSPSSSHSRPPIGAIVGGALGGLLVLLLLVLSVLLLQRRRREQQGLTPSSSESDLSPFLTRLIHGNGLTPFSPSRLLTKGADPYSMAAPARLSQIDYDQGRTPSAPNILTGSDGSGAPIPVSQPLEKTREALAESSRRSLDRNREVIRHQDSGIRLTGEASPIIEEFPPIYTLT